jgi:hypothetical protein
MTSLRILASVLRQGAAVAKTDLARSVLSTGYPRAGARNQFETIQIELEEMVPESVEKH